MLWRCANYCKADLKGIGGLSFGVSISLSPFWYLSNSFLNISNKNYAILETSFRVWAKSTEILFSILPIIGLKMF
jgi:hypothetical protein